ncbi:MAG: ABC transporter [Zetaproteobacteria bacterium CG_4_9_14_3_um_filter_49_83]|nr:MAG: ABC transporter [Zetaproteobacteria bacterium CG1_02_49_23]PIQ33773.1 MAG: ABC transporter [Zetaproteobacteria bacterium CG17_big_fil_post_rev_8_21_14_2_50_50_13]PIV29987.1 MAG: ABC transporter [Zetaproteobacteria bacterium CG02_land_8_20_14_3_00_50_9]PIY55091.1 MAG: ABC transporter [Zetaproteobacteria bacterium CG_4_10_14_0_8_um_filter_49_80]PJA36557.1 MAG: ABC transporter [Zetaproteobacteria bacterium CG_4_9_14_3_um_filter_49_83]
MTALEIHGLSKTYGNGKIALQDVSLSVAKGSFYALLGPNGAGKSTLINILADTVRSGGGSVRLFGHDLFTDRSWCKRRMGVVPQEIAFDPFFTPREVLHFTSGLFGKKADDAWIDELFDRLELSQHTSKNTRQLSGGMRRRLLVAQALVHRPELVILDEPTAGVDVELRRRLWSFMRELNAKGTTILLTTHYLDEAEELCDQVAIINHGKLLTAQPMADLMRQVASSCLWLRYQQTIELSPADHEILAQYAPRTDAQGLYLQLGLQDDGQSTFHQAYQAAVDRFGPPLDAGVRKEDLEDVFLRLTARQVGEAK